MVRYSLYLLQNRAALFQARAGAMLNVEPDRFASVKSVEATPIAYEDIVWPYRIALPLMNAIAAYVLVKKLLLKSLDRKPRINFLFFDGLSINSRRMKEGATRWPSLDTCYNFAHGEGQTALHRSLDQWWMRIRNAQAVRNRLAIARTELTQAIVAAHSDTPVRILSLAAGTAQGVIEAAAECKALGIATEIVLVDHDRSALRYASDYAHRRGVAIKVVEGNVLFFTRFLSGFQADIVEMIGFLDYLRDGLAMALLKKVRSHLCGGGLFLCAHIHHNGEAFFLKHVVDWNGGMLYRSREAFEDLLVTGGFAQSCFVTEPHQIHTISISNPDCDSHRHSVLPFPDTRPERAAPKKSWRHGDDLTFDPFATSKASRFVRACQFFGSPGWAFYLIARGIGADIASLIERIRQQP